MESETMRTLRCHKQEDDNWRRRCGCLRTSEKLKQILDSFPPPPPPTPDRAELKPITPLGNTCISAYCTNVHQSSPSNKNVKPYKEAQEECCYTELSSKKISLRSWRVLVSELVHLVQLSVTATALALYYLIYCYMQLIYYTLRSALYFHNADGAMKITIGVVTITSIFVAFNVILKIERVIGIL